MNKYTLPEYLEMMKVIHCLGIDDFKEMRMMPWGEPVQNYNEEYHQMKKDWFGWYCRLEVIDQHKVFEFARQRQIVRALTKVGMKS